MLISHIISEEVWNIIDVPILVPYTYVVHIIYYMYYNYIEIWNTAERIADAF